jgi:hypothetical protein
MSSRVDVAEIEIRRFAFVNACLFGVPLRGLAVAEQALR